MGIEIESRHVDFAYALEDGSFNFALHDVNVQINEGEFAVILGHNGSGKSTFARLLNALEVPADGDVTVGEMNTKDESKILDIRRSVGMVFQNPDNQLVATVVDEDVAFGPENLGVPQEEIVRRVDESLAAVEMCEYKKHAPHMLSGGQKQRIAIAGALAMAPKAIVFDEATAMLDPKGRREILEIAHRLNREEKMTIILITHFMEEAIDADKVIVLNNGGVEKVGTPKEVLLDEQLLEKCGLKAPFATRLSMDLCKEGIIKEHFLTDEDLVNELCQLK